MGRGMKQFLAFLLTVCMVFGNFMGIPVTATEEEQGEIATGFVATDNINWDGDVPMVRAEAEYGKEFYATLSGTTIHAVYRENENETTLTPESLSFFDGNGQEASEKVNVVKNDGNGDLLDFRFSALGDYTVKYGEESIVFHVGYPELGYYSEPEVSEAGFLREFFYPDVNENTFYMVPYLEGCSISENTLSFCANVDGNRITEPQEVEKYFTYAPVDGKENVYKITVFEQGWMDIIVSAELVPEEGDSWTIEGWIGTQYQPRTEGLVAQSPMWNEEGPQPNTQDTFYKEMYVDMNRTTLYLAYLESEEDEEPSAVRAEDITVTYGDVTISDFEEENAYVQCLPDGQNPDMTEFIFKKTGNYVITYPDGTVGNTMTVYVDYPIIGFYTSEPEVSEAGILREFFYPDVNENTFYMVPYLEGCSISENTLSFCANVDGNRITDPQEIENYFTYAPVDGKENVYKITVFEQGWMEIIVSAELVPEEGESWTTEGCIVTQYQPRTEGLVAQSPMWNEEGPQPNTQDTFYKEMYVDMNRTTLYLAYLENEEDKEPSAVRAEYITVTYGDVTISDFEEENAYVQCLPNGQNPDMTEFIFKKTGKYVITYSDGAVGNTMTVYVDYPIIGFYTSEPEVSEAGILREFFYPSVSENTFYMVPHLEGCFISENTLSFCAKVDGNRITDPQEIENYFTYAPVDGKENVYKITVFEQGWMEIIVSAELVPEEGESWTTEGCIGTQYQPRTEGLVAQSPMWNEEGPQPNTQDTFYKEMYVDMNRTTIYLAYLESEEDKEPSAVRAEDITVTYGDVTISDFEEENAYVQCLPNGQNPDMTEFIFKKTGKYVITYQDGAVGNTMTVYVDYPVIGFYTSNEMSEEGFLGEEFVYTGENKECYLLFNTTDKEISNINLEVMDYFSNAATLTELEENASYKVTLTDKQAAFRVKLNFDCTWNDGKSEEIIHEMGFRHEEFVGKKAYTDGVAHTGYAGCYISEDEYKKNVVFYNDNDAMYWVHADTVQGVIDKLSKVANGEEVLYKETVEFDTGIVKPDTEDTTEGIDIINTGYIHVVTSHHGNVELKPQYVSSSGNMKGINFVSGQDVYMTVHEEVDGVYIEDKVYNLNALRRELSDEEEAEIIPKSLANTEFVSKYLGEIYHVNHVTKGNLDYYTLGEAITYDDGKEDEQRTALTDYLNGNMYAAFMEPFKYPEMHVNIYCDMRFGGRFEKLSIGFKEGYNYKASVVEGSTPERYDQVDFTRDDLEGKSTNTKQATVTYWNERTGSEEEENITVWLYDINSETTTSGSYEGTIDVAETPEPNAMTELTQDQKDAIEQSSKLTVDMKAEKKAEAELESEVKKSIEDLVKNENADKALYIDLSVSAKVEGVEGTTNITELKAPMDITIDIPEDVHKRGKKFRVIRHHKKDGKHKTEKIDATMSPDGKKIRFKTDRFSTYAIIYEEEAEVHTHTSSDWIVTKAATEQEVGTKVKKCTECGEILETEEIAKLAHVHTPGEWIVTREATAKKAGLKEQKCTSCGEVLASETLPKFKVTLNVSKVALQKGKSTTAIKATVMEGDKIKSWKSSNKSVATVSSKGKITAKKVGTATITVTTKKGATAKVKITVQKKAVKCTKLKVDKKNITLKVKKTYQLKVTKTPVTTLEKVTYKSSNKKVATVSKSGKITAKKAGKATITVKCGKKTVKVKVTVKKK